MILCKFLVILLVSKDALCFHGLRGIINIKSSGDKQLGYHLRSGDFDRSEKDPGFREHVNLDYNPGGSAEDDATERTVLIIVEPTRTVKDGLVKDVPDERSKNGSDLALPLHVTNTARQQCLDGYQADENGICQKMMQPKNDKSFKLRRRKRAEQTVPKLSYADVVKYGRNPPKELLTTVKAELLTKKPDIAKIPATTPPAPTTTRPKASDLSKTSSRVPVTTVRVAPVTQKPAVVASQTTIKPATPAVVASPTTTKPATPAAVASKTAKPSVAVTTPPVVAKFTNKPSISGDINQAFLFGEKASVVSQSMDGKVKPVVVPVAAKKTVDATRLRRWIGFF